MAAFMANPTVVGAATWSSTAITTTSIPTYLTTSPTTGSGSVTQWFSVFRRAAAGTGDKDQMFWDDDRHPDLVLRHKKIALHDRTKMLMALNDDAPVADDVVRQVDGYALPAGNKYALPDGSLLVVDAAGNYAIENAEAKVVYKANRVREFNPYVNASDLLERFIIDVGEMGATQGEVLDLPIEAFINWVILQAAKRDGDPTDDLPSVEDVLRRPPPVLALPAPVPARGRCLSCGRYLRKAWATARIEFCSPVHLEKRLTQLGVLT